MKQKLNHDEMIVDYLKLCERNYSRSTVDDRRNALARIRAVADEQGLDLIDLDMDALNVIRDSFGPVKKVTIKGYLNHLIGYLDYLDDRGIEVKDRVRRYKRNWVKDTSTEMASVSRIAPTTEEVRRLLAGIGRTRDLAYALLCAKLGLRRTECMTLRVSHLDLENGWLTLDQTAKRTNRRLPLDEETVRLLERWLQVRQRYRGCDSDHLFLSRLGDRMKPSSMAKQFQRYSKAAGLWRSVDPFEKRVTLHHLRHWFTSTLVASRMPRPFIQHLRGDTAKEAIDIYTHLRHDEVKREYMRAMPRLLTRKI